MGEVSIRILNGRDYTIPRNASITYQKSSIFDHFWYLFEHLARPGEDLGANWKSSEFQKLVLDDF